MIVLNGQKGSMSTYRCPQWSLHAKSAVCTKRCLHGATKNAGVENEGASKMKGWKSREWKSWHQKVGVENAGETSMESQH